MTTRFDPIDVAVLIAGAIAAALDIDAAGCNASASRRCAAT